MNTAHCPNCKSIGTKYDSSHRCLNCSHTVWFDDFAGITHIELTQYTDKNEMTRYRAYEVPANTNGPRLKIDSLMYENALKNAQASAKTLDVEVVDLTHKSELYGAYTLEQAHALMVKG